MNQIIPHTLSAHTRFPHEFYSSYECLVHYKSEDFSFTLNGHVGTPPPPPIIMIVEPITTTML